MEKPEELVIREGGLGDFNAVEVLLRSLPKYYVEEAVPHVFQDLKAGKLKLAVLGSREVGFLIWRDLDATTTELLWMAVLPQYWSRGVGTALLRCALHESRHSSQIFLRTASPDSVIEGTEFEGAAYLRTIAFFEHQGFVRTKLLKDYWATGNHCLVLEYRGSEVV